MNNKKINDGFHSDLAADAVFDGILEIPEIQKPSYIKIPKALIPFTARKRSLNHEEFISFYEHDVRFNSFLKNPSKYLSELKAFPGIITPDCSLYRDMPLILQLVNIYKSRLLGYYLQKQGFYVIPNVRWGDERTFSTCVLPEKAAFLGIPSHRIVAISTYGCIKSRADRFYFKNGLAAMIETLSPAIILVHGSMPYDVFKNTPGNIKLIQYNNWISLRKKKVL